MVGGSTSKVSTANPLFHINSDYVGGAAYMHIHQLNIFTNNTASVGAAIQ